QFAAASNIIIPVEPMDLSQHDDRHSTRLAAERARCVPRFSAKGATHSRLAWGNAPDFKVPQRSELKARFISRRNFYPVPNVKCAFSAFNRGNFNSWGADPGWHETAPLALNMCPKRCLCSVLQK